MKKVLLLLLLLLLLFITYMHGIYNYIPETNHVSSAYSVAAAFTVCATCNVTSHVECPVLLHQRFPQYVWSAQYGCFCSSLFRAFPACYSGIGWVMVPVAPIIVSITFAFTFHMRWISITRFLCIKILSASFLTILLSPEIAPSVNMHVPFLLSRIMMSGLLLGIGSVGLHLLVP